VLLLAAEQHDGHDHHGDDERAERHAARSVHRLPLSGEDRKPGR
jgi:hypothetical protein